MLPGAVIGNGWYNTAMTEPFPAVTPARMLARGARRRCPRCGSGGLFPTWFRMTDRCPRCDLSFEREEGYWTGAVMVNLAVTEVVFLAVFVALIVATWPDPPWALVLAIVVAVNVVVPALLYPFSRTLWLAGDLAFRQAVGGEGP